jgi:transposase InsO family protein
MKEERAKIGSGEESAPLGGEGGAARTESRYRSDGYRYTRPHDYETKRKVVRLYLEEGMPAELVARELEVSKACVFDWVRQYRENGEAGLKPKPYGHRTVNAADAVGEKIRSIKRNNPHFGVKRISQILRRLFFLKASPETVRQRLKKAGLQTKAVKARAKAKPKVHFFERSAANETWQSDITTIRFQDKNAYIIGFIDDYSRYIVGLGVYRSQKAEQVLEVYRTAVGNYGVPKEMLTDNGRQYATWRGVSEFQKELRKDKVHHIRSAPHHPQTLGKIERFWKTLKDEFLNRARFETFEEARERIAYWIKFYNHKRPHQSLDGLCPADRYFSIQQEMRSVIEKGVAENVEELALRGQPVQPFYMVGQMGEQSVVIRAEGGKLKMLVDGAEGKEIEYGMEKKNEDRRNDEEAKTVEDIQRKGKEQGGVVAVVGSAERVGDMRGAGDELGGSARVGAARAGGNDGGAGAGLEEGRAGRDPAGEPDREVVGDDGTGCGGRAGGDSGNEVIEGGIEDEDNNGTGCDGQDVVRGGEVPGGAGGVDGAQERERHLQGNEYKRELVEPVAGARDGRYAGGAGTAGTEAVGERVCAGEYGEETAGTEEPGTGPDGDSQGRQTGDAEAGKETAEVAGREDSGDRLTPGERNGDGRGDERGSELVAVARNGVGTGCDQGAGKTDDGHGSGGEDGGKPEDILREGKARAGRDACGAGEEGARAACGGSGSGEGGTEEGPGRDENGRAVA